MMARRRRPIQWIAGLLASLSGMGWAHGSDDLPHQAARLLQLHCVKCHNDRDRVGGLSLATGDGLRQGGDSGEVIEPGDAEGSYLVDLITPEDGRAAMPKDSPPLSREELATLRRWIRQGAVWPDGVVLHPPTQVDRNWWSLQPLSRPAIPAIEPAAAARRWIGGAIHPIDAFVFQKLQLAGLSWSPPAERRVLARRLYYDLIGLPPTPEELEAFESDPDPRAYERLVDRLLDSPRYGERWARHWLDVVQYADTHGYDKDKPRPNAWPYRDYVIRSLNEDKPWRQFVEEQIAGDVLRPDDPDGIIAMGFIAAGPWDLVGHEEVPESKIDGKLARHLDRDDMVRNTVQSFMSLTIGCAQCHHHKFDPISQVEYYQMQSVFAALDRADRPYYADRAVAQRAAALQDRQRAVEQAVESVRAMVLSRGHERFRELEQWLAVEQDPATRDALSAERDTLLRQSLTDEEWAAWQRAVARQREVTGELAELPAPQYVYAGTVHHGTGSFCGTGPGGGRPREIRVLSRGDVTQPGETVDPGALSLVPGLDSEWDLPADHAESDRRAALARWLGHRENSFTWRSIVNRVWHYHFGKGLVETPNDFGQMGGAPSHPELLDWLACEFRDGRQSLKDLHRLIVTSHTYRQSSVVDPRSETVARAQRLDAENRLLWRAPRRKLDAESVRDSLLAISGKLDLTMGGPAFQEFVIEKPEHSPHYRYDLCDFQDVRTHRRSIYRFTVRSQLQPFLTALDCADPSQQVARRNESQSPLQALAMLNNGLVLTMSAHFAEKLSELEAERPAQVGRGFLEVTGRTPTAEELALLTDYAGEHGLENTCRVLFNLNEFLFID